MTKLAEEDLSEFSDATIQAEVRRRKLVDAAWGRVIDPLRDFETAADCWSRGAHSEALIFLGRCLPEPFRDLDCHLMARR